MKIDEGMIWDGIISFSVIDENDINKLGLMNDERGILEAIQSGELKCKRKLKQKNKVTNYARQAFIKLLIGTPQALYPTQMELGTGTGVPASTDTDLWSPSTPTFKQCSTIQQYLTYFAQYVTVWQTSDPIQNTWTEIGLKDSSGNLWAHAAITSNLTVNSGEVLIGQWVIQIIGN